MLAKKYSYGKHQTSFPKYYTAVTVLENTVGAS